MRGQAQPLVALDAEDLEADAVAHILAGLTDLADGFNAEPLATSEARLGRESS